MRITDLLKKVVKDTEKMVKTEKQLKAEKEAKEKSK